MATNPLLPVWGKNPAEWTAEEVLQVAREPEAYRVSRYRIDLTNERSGELGNLLIQPTDLCRYIRLAPEPGSGECDISLDPDTRPASRQDNANFLFFAPGQAMTWAFHRFTLANKAQPGASAVVEVSPRLPLPQVIEPTANAQGVQKVSPVAQSPAINPADVLRARLAKTERERAAGTAGQELNYQYFGGTDAYTAASPKFGISANSYYHGNLDLILPNETDIPAGKVRCVAGLNVQFFCEGGAGGEDLNLSIVNAEIRLTVGGAPDVAAYHIYPRTRRQKIPATINSANIATPRLDILCDPFEINRANNARGGDVALTINFAIRNSGAKILKDQQNPGMYVAMAASFYAVDYPDSAFAV